MELPNDALVNYVFPNNLHVVWSLMIVIYPFITGLIAGAFVVSSLSHVMKVKAFEPIANFALIAALSFGFFAGLPLLVHLGQPQRALEIYFTPHLTSPMSLFGYVYGSYLILLMIEVWLIYRPHFIRMANETSGLQALIWKTLTLGVTTYHPDAARIDHKLITVLAGLGIPWAFTLHGYVGFVFGSVKAIPWWATALQPIIFLSSAVVSGMAMLLVMYTVVKWRRRERCDHGMIRTFATILWAVFILDAALELLELLHVHFQQGYEWQDIRPLIMGPLFNTYVLGQLGVLSLVPLMLLGLVAVFKLRDRLMLTLANIGAFCLIFQVLVMRFNVVVGGQLISKSGRGFVTFHWDIFGKEGVITALVILTAPFVTYYILSRFLPVFETPGRPAAVPVEEPAGKPVPAGGGAAPVGAAAAARAGAGE